MNDQAASNIAKSLSTSIIIGAGTAIGNNTASTATAVNVDANNRQLHPDERAWIEKNAKVFAKQQGISNDEAEQRLAQQAAKQTDLLWLLALPKGNDAEAQAFLASPQQTFTNEAGKQQAYFSTQHNDFVRPEKYATDATLDQHYYQKNLISKNNSNVGKGLVDVTNKLSTKTTDYVANTPASQIAEDGLIATKNIASSAWQSAIQAS